VTSTLIGAEPVLRLGAASPGGLMLPAAEPTAGQMYAPRGVWTDGTRIIACDSGNHRVLIWHTWPDHDGADADVVLGQPDFVSEGPAAGGESVDRGMYLPTGIAVIHGDLVVADAWHHRLLIFDGIPQSSFALPRAIFGQSNPHSVKVNRGGDPSLTSLNWPFGFAVVAGVFWIADTGNRRVLGWRGTDVPEDGRAADILLGQDDESGHSDNRGDGVGPVSFRWPHAVTGDESTLLIADAGDHRILGWTPPPLDGERAADLVLGQDDHVTNAEFKNRPQGAQRLRFPYSAVMMGERLTVADTSNNRILLWDQLPRTGFAVPADAVLAQPDLDANGENRWDAVADDSLCWPYGLSAAQDLLAIADSGNNRVVIWRLPS